MKPLNDVCNFPLTTVLGALISIHVVSSDAEQLTSGQIVKMNSVFFEHYSRRNPLHHDVLDVHNENSLQNFNISLPLKVLIHGWLGTPFYMKIAKDTYLAMEDCNVVMVNWSKMSLTLCYKRALNNTELVGRLTARLLDKMASLGQDLGQVHLTGHSLGGHIAGMVGAFTSAGRVGKITGLDPAGPGFEIGSLRHRLDPSDGVLVEAIHTNEGHLGSTMIMGHMDFYPNGGRHQPGCLADNLISGGCSHLRSLYYFTESIITPFVGTKCDSYKNYKHGKCKGNPSAIMGEKMVMSEPGKYYLRTNPVPPYLIK